MLAVKGDQGGLHGLLQETHRLDNVNAYAEDCPHGFVQRVGGGPSRIEIRRARAEGDPADFTHADPDCAAR